MIENYDANSVQHLSFREGVRKRVGIYLGSADHTGVIAALLELINNATDEKLAKPTANSIEVVVGSDWASCRDYGRGMPHGPNSFSKEVMINLLTENHSGAKFDDNAYGGKSRGMNGTGSAATCCSSDWFKISSYRDGAEWYMEFEKGIPKWNECQKRPLNGQKEGTYIIFKPSQEVFKAEPVHFDFEEICAQMKEYSYFNKGITFIVINAETKEKRTYVSKNGLMDFVKDNFEKPIHKTPLHLQITENDIDVEIILQWTGDRNERFYLFSNGGENENGGTPITGIKTALTNFFKKRVKGDSPDILRKGLVYVCSVNLKEPIYDGQTKSKITNPELRGLCQRATTKMLEDFERQHKPEFDKVVEMLTKEIKAEVAAEKARQSVLDNAKEVEKAGKKKFLDSDKLSDARSLGKDAILLVVEGKSAGGTMQKARDVDKYGILRLRGKIINALSNDLEDVLKNEEVSLFLKATGINIHDYSKSNLRYGRVAICVDADDDGMHIACLIMALLYKLAPQYLKENRLCWLHAPLFKITKGKTTSFYYSEEDLPKGKGGVQVRFKGLGEMNTDDAKCMFNEDQWLEVLEWSDDAAESIESLMGEDSQPKREFIFNNIDFEKYGEK